jgi:hypothetical protein
MVIISRGAKQPLDRIRKNGLAGLAIYFSGLLTALVGFSIELYPATPFALALIGTGFVIAVTATSQTSKFRELVSVGIIFGAGLFYFAASHEIHIPSGFGFEHQTHIMLGLILVTLSAIIVTVLSMPRNYEKKLIEK